MLNEQLKINESLPQISFDYEGLKAWAISITEQFSGLVVTEDDIAAIKSEMAGLNKAKDMVETARKEAVKRVSAPIKEFEAQVKDVVTIITEARAALAEQVKRFEDQQREDRRVAVQFQIDAIKVEHGVNIDIPVQDAWLNKTKKLSDVKSAVEAIILQHLKAEREREELLRARQERAFAVEQRVLSKNESCGLSVSISAFQRLTDSDTPLEEVYRQIDHYFYEAHQHAEAEKLRAAERQRRAEEAAAARQQAAQQQTSAQRQAPVQQSRRELRTLSIMMEYDAVNEGAVSASLDALLSLATRKKVTRNQQQAA
ncbi:DUF1351 domain-containing protein [Oleidesulfovibrio sp.]|uniref:DUF1351 domain-containing protein n=1 Tax=Oleidesulfovibrio sp. TaxID=2909707 RepID=UPI003A84519D